MAYVIRNYTFFFDILVLCTYKNINNKYWHMFYWNERSRVLKKQFSLKKVTDDT